MTLLQQNGIAAGLVQDAADLMNDPGLIARDFFIIDKEGKEIADANPIRFSRTPAVYHRDAPATGRDNDYVYRRLLGLSVDEITHLEEQGII